MDGVSFCNHFHANGYLLALSDTKLLRTDDYTSSALSTFDTTEGQVIAYVGRRVYLVQPDCHIYRMMTNGSLLEGHYNPADDLIPIFATGLKDDLLIVGSILNGELRVMRTVAYAKTSVRKLEDMAVLPKDTADYPSASCPFCVHDNDLWLLSGAHPNPDGTVTRDLLAYSGYRVERVARIPAPARRWGAIRKALIVGVAAERNRLPARSALVA
jgi:hypothetical protein